MKTLRDFPRPKVFVPFLAYDWRGDVSTYFSYLDTIFGSHAEIVPPIANFQDGVARSRNAVTYHFRKKTDAEFLFFASLDIKWTSQDFDRILEHMVIGGHDIVAGLYAGKGPKLKWICTTFEKDVKPDPVTGLLQAKQVGTDFLCIRRKVFDVIEEKMPELRYSFNPIPGKEPDPHVNFFGMPVHEGELESEDWNFSRIARECGFKCYVDTKTLVLHRGNIYFPLHASMTAEEICELVFHRFKFDLASAMKAAAPAAPAISA